MRHIDIRLTKIRIAAAAFGLALVLQATLPFLSAGASAGTLTNTMVRFDRLAQSQATTGTVCAKPATVGTESSIAVTFPTGFTVSGTVGNWITNTSSTGAGWPTGGTAWLSSGTSGAVNSAAATSVVGQVVTWTSSDLTVGTLYCFNWSNTAAISTGTAASYSGSMTTTVDSGNYATTIVGTNADQIAVSATISPTFSETISNNGDALGALSTGSVAVSPTPRVITVNTNAANGWYTWMKDSNAGLTSTTASYTIASNCTSSAGTNTTLSAGTEGYNIGVVASNGTGTGSITVATPFVGGSTGRGGGQCTNYQTIASSGGTAGGSTLTVTNNAAISGVSKPATDYADTETFVGAGLF